MKEILLVSDSSVVIKSIKKFCLGLGDNVTHFTKASDALEMLFNKKFDLIITSVFLDGIDGVQFITTIRRSNTMNSEATIVLLTSGGDASELFSIETSPDLILEKNQKTLESFEKFYYSRLKSSLNRKLRLLYIDDDPFIQTIITSWFKKVPEIELSICGSIKELKDYVHIDFDIVVSDNVLEDGNILNVLEVFKQSEFSNVPILIYTGTVDKLKLDELAKIGNVIDVLPKPFEMKGFMKKIERLRNK